MPLAHGPHRGDNERMTTVREIKKAIERLPKASLARFRAWFEGFDAAAWDAQFEEDARSGKLDKPAALALKDLKAGRCKGLEQTAVGCSPV